MNARLIAYKILNQTPIVVACVAVVVIAWLVVAPVLAYVLFHTYGLFWGTASWL